MRDVTDDRRQPCKSAAGLVLTAPGLRGIRACTDEGRAAFQRVLACTPGTVANKAVTLVVMGRGLVMTGHAVMPPMLWVLAFGRMTSEG